MYLRWDSNQNTVIRLVKLKAKLTPLDQRVMIRDIFLAVQEGKTFLSTTTDRLVYKYDIGLLVCGGCVQAFKEDKVAVPI